MPKKKVESSLISCSRTRFAFPASDMQKSQKRVTFGWVILRSMIGADILAEFHQT